MNKPHYLLTGPCLVTGLSPVDLCSTFPQVSGSNVNEKGDDE
jgi:hypothetical protein